MKISLPHYRCVIFTILASQILIVKELHPQRPHHECENWWCCGDGCGYMLDPHLNQDPAENCLAASGFNVWYVRSDQINSAFVVRTVDRWILLLRLCVLDVKPLAFALSTSALVKISVFISSHHRHLMLCLRATLGQNVLCEFLLHSLLIFFYFVFTCDHVCLVYLPKVSLDINVMRFGCIIMRQKMLLSLCSCI